MAMAYAYREEPESSSEITAPKKNSKTGKTTTRRTTPTTSRAATATQLDVEVLDTVEIQTEAVVNPAKGDSTPSRGRMSVAARAKAEAETVEKHRKWAEHMAELEAKRDHLIDRLDQGAAKIQQARQEGNDVSSWEDFWIQLLRSYEQVCDDIRNLSLGQP